MIKASFTSNLNHGKRIEFECHHDRLCLFNGREALSVLDVMSIKNLSAYSGSFVVDGNDLLDVTNIKRDRTPASVISASSTSCVVTRSQVPFGSTPKTEKIDERINKYINLKGVPTQYQSSFFLTVQSVYVELCAHPAYVVLDMHRADKAFATMVVDLLNKVLSAYRVYVHAPQLFPYPTEDIVFYEDIASVLTPAAPKAPETPKPQVSVRELAMAYFFDDLVGNHPTIRPSAPQEKETIKRVEPAPAPSPVHLSEIHREEPKPVVKHEEPVKTHARNDIPTEEASEEKSFFRFDPSKTDVYNFIFSVVFFALAVVITFVFFSFKTEDENRIKTFFWICLAMCTVFNIMSVVPIASLITDNKGPRIRDSKFLVVSMILFPFLALVSGIVVFSIGSKTVTHTWTPEHYVPFGIVFMLYLVLVPAFVFLYKKLKKK